MSVYEEVSRKNTLSKIFMLFDPNRSGFVDVASIEKLVNCLMVLQSGVLEQDKREVHENTREIASRVVARACDRIELVEFLNAALAVPCPFDFVLHGPGLTHTLLHFFDVANYALLDELFPFTPTYEYQVIEVFQSIPRNCESILSVCNSNRMAKISDPLQADLTISNGHHVRVWLSRYDTPDVICRKIVENWPGVRGRNFHPPAAANLELLKDGSRVPIRETVESLGMFQDTSAFLVHLLGDPLPSNCAHPHPHASDHPTEVPPKGTDSTMRHTQNSTNPHRHRETHRPHDNAAHTHPYTHSHAPPHPPPSETWQDTSSPPVTSAATSGMSASEYTSSDPAPGTCREASLPESQRLTDRFCEIRQEIVDEAKLLRHKVRLWQDKVTVERDIIPCRGEMYEPYREDLRQQAKALSNDLVGLESALNAILE